MQFMVFGKNALWRGKYESCSGNKDLRVLNDPFVTIDGDDDIPLVENWAASSLKPRSFDAGWSECYQKYKNIFLNISSLRPW